MSGTLLIQVLVKRSNVLDALTDSSASKGELTSELDLSRSTINRAIDELEEFGLVEDSGAGYQITPTGRIVLTKYTDITSDFGNVHRCSDLLNVLPVTADIDSRLLKNADVVRSTTDDPNTPLNHLSQYFKRHRTAVAIFDHLPIDLIAIAAEQYAKRREANLHVYVGRAEGGGVVHPAPFAKNKLENIHIKRVQESPPFGLILSRSEPESSAVVVFDEFGTIRGVVTSKTASAVIAGSLIIENFVEEDMPRITPNPQPS